MTRVALSVSAFRAVVRWAAVFALFGAVVLPARAQEERFLCGGLSNNFGPFDYRVENAGSRTALGLPIRMVEGAHFTPEVETLKRGKTGVNPGADIDYTLRAFPNHHRALLAMMNLSFKEKTSKPRGSRYTIDCWFERGARFRPDDAVVKMLWGIYTLKVGRRDEAIKLLQEAEKAATEDPNLYYNLGLAFFDLKRYDDSLKYAHMAYALNYPLPGLREKLKRAGIWKDLPPKTKAAEPASAQSAPVLDGANQSEAVKAQ
ncbi:hypothetical protein OPU71_12035 [Niveibacterium sp. 24ML]|uniref:hypothetical protein n=1 Tax=Niveibacterium sp. 24ML TaxID=2985512 RepID=UPI00227214EC|nr:hypothetical protein [Niveibacterium sp. 24ML]MCX9156854.1 hypothetical protein [Niveibacterium sp. 24ML]